MDLIGRNYCCRGFLRSLAQQSRNVTPGDGEEMIDPHWDEGVSPADEHELESVCSINMRDHRPQITRSGSKAGVKCSVKEGYRTLKSRFV